MWRNNLVVKSTGDLRNDFDDNALLGTQRGPRFDLGFVGSGYWVQGGGFGIRLEDNVAASINAAGFDLVHNIDQLANVELIPVELIADPIVRQAVSDAGYAAVTPSNIPTRGMDGATVYNSFRGIHTWLHNRDSGDMEGRFVFATTLAHEFRSTIENYRLWNVQNGVQNFYSTRFRLSRRLDRRRCRQSGSLCRRERSTGQQQRRQRPQFTIMRKANHIRFDDVRIEGFEYGFQVFQSTEQHTRRAVALSRE